MDQVNHLSDISKAIIQGFTAMSQSKPCMGIEHRMNRKVYTFQTPKAESTEQ